MRLKNFSYHEPSNLAQSFNLTDQTTIITGAEDALSSFFQC